MPHAQQQLHGQIEGVTVVGEAVRRVSPERAEFLIEITASAPTVAQAMRENHARTAQVTQSISGLGVQAQDLQTVSLNVFNLYSPLQGLPSAWGNPAGQTISAYGVPQALPQYGAASQPLSAYGSPQQVGQSGFTPYMTPSTGQPDVQFGSYQAKNTLRVNVREPGRVGEIVDAVTRAGAVVIGPFCFRPTDEASARRAALEAAGKDARAKAETLATAAGKQLAEPISITEDILASNGTYMALRSVMPLAFGAGAPQTVGELEYYARVSACFRLQ